MTINALGIGHDIDDDTLNEIAGKNGKVYMVHDYDKLIAQLAQIKNLACGM